MAFPVHSITAALCAALVSLGPGLVWAQGESQAPSGGGQSQSGAGDAGQKPDDQPRGEQKATEPTDASVPPSPAGVGGAAGAAHDDTAPKNPVDSLAPKPAGLGSLVPPTDATTKTGQEEGATTTTTRAPAARPGVGLSGRPFAGVYGGAAPAGSRNQWLDLSGSLYGVRTFYPGVSGGETDPALGPANSTYAGGGGSLSYGRGWTHGAIGADASVSEAYIPEYKDIDSPWITRWDAGARAGYSRGFGRKWTFGSSATVNYSPYLQQSLFQNGPPTVGIPPVGAPGLDYVLARQPSVWTAGQASLSYAINARNSIDSYYSLNYREFTEGDQPSQYDQMAGARYRFQFNRYVGARAGYGFRYARYGLEDAKPQKSHFIDAGLDGGYGRSYALTRRTTFSFNTGSSIFASDEVRQDGNPDEFDPQARFTVDASADLTHSWARTWSVNVGYRRGVGYEVGFNQPFLSDSAFGAVGGLLAPRLDFTASAYYTTGSVGFSGQDNGFSSGSAVASLRAAITSNVATYVQYFYYRNFYGSGVTVPFYLQRDLERQGVTVGLTAWLPLIPARGRP